MMCGMWKRQKFGQQIFVPERVHKEYHSGEKEKVNEIKELRG